MNEVMVADRMVATRSLTILVGLIKEQLNLAQEAGVPYFMKAGALMLEAKASFHTASSSRGWRDTSG